jgi:hypothetical protein
VSNQLSETLLRHLKSPLRTGRSQGGMLTTGDSRNGISMQVEFGVAEQVTVSFDNTATAGGVEALAQATIEFTIDGTSIVRTIDVAAGASISGVAQAVRVRVLDMTSTSLVVSTPTSYGVTISVAVMPRPTTAVPPVLTGLTNKQLSQNGTVTVQVPAGADSFVVYGQTASGQPTGIEVAQQTAQGTATIQQSVPTLGQFVPLLMGCGRLLITNLSATTATVSVIWGIDG